MSRKGQVMSGNWFYSLLGGFAVFSYVSSTQASDMFTEKEVALYQEHCAVCHDDVSDEPLGPSHSNVFGSLAGSDKNFPYSEAILKSGLIWDRETLLVFLKDPQALLPGNSMGFMGIDSVEERELIVSYLMKLKQKNNGLK